jgi:hypothetical protein
MNAPDRSVEVIGIVNQHFDLFGTDDTRRGILFFVCRDLNLVDEGRWGVLVKTDQNNFIPSDIIIDAVTREHFDVLAGDPDRPSWQPRGVLTNPAWLWAPADLVKHHAARATGAASAGPASRSAAAAGAGGSAHGRRGAARHARSVRAIRRRRRVIADASQHRETLKNGRQGRRPGASVSDELARIRERMRQNREARG